MKSFTYRLIVPLLMLFVCCVLCQCRKRATTTPVLVNLGDSILPNVKLDTTIAIPLSSVKAAANSIAAMVRLAKINDQATTEINQLTETAKTTIGEISTVGNGIVSNTLTSNVQDVLARRVLYYSSICNKGITARQAATLDAYRDRWQYELKVAAAESCKLKPVTSDAAMTMAKDHGQIDLSSAMNWLWNDMLSSCVGGYADPWLNAHAKDSGVKFNDVVKGARVSGRQTTFEFANHDPHYLVVLYNVGSGCQLVSPEKETVVLLSQVGATSAAAQLQAIVGTALASSDMDSGLEGNLAMLVASSTERANSTAAAVRSLKSLITSVTPLLSCLEQAKSIQAEVHDASQALDELKKDFLQVDDEIKVLRSQREQILRSN